VRQYENIKFVRDSSPLIPAALTKKKKRDVDGVLVHLNFQRNKSLKKLEWKFCKRFMFGSLLCFSMDDFQTIHLATVVDRDMDYLTAGFFKIEFCEHPSINIYASSFKMIESEVFFDPYNHVLRTLQTLDESNFPFAEYIISYQKDVYPPKYLEVEPAVIYNLPQCHFPVLPLDTNTWPSQRDLDLDDSQYRALYMGLTRELAVIQGPPGTGKTFIGLKIAQILVQNREASKRHTPILVVCLTNHALDQFLVGISKFTSSIVRIGGQSKCEDMDRFNLRVLRHHSRLASSRYANAKRQLEVNQRQLAEIDTSLKELGRGILTLDCLVQKGEAANNLFYNDTQLLIWLFSANLATSKTTFGRTSFSLTLYELESTMEELVATTCNDPKQLHDRNLELRKLENVMELLKEKMENAQPCDKNQARNWSQNKDMLSLENRWRLYKHWCGNVERTLQQEIVDFQREIASLQKQIGELQEVEDLEILRGAEVVGLTTSGAARLHGLMKELGAEIGKKSDPPAPVPVVVIDHDFSDCRGGSRSYGDSRSCLSHTKLCSPDSHW
jgi:AAA domain